MTRRIRIIVVAVALTAAAGAGVAAVAGGGDEVADADLNIGVPAPGFEGKIDETQVSGGNGITSPVPAPGFEGGVDEMTVIQGPVEEGVIGSGRVEEQPARDRDGQQVPNGEFSGDESEPVVRDGPVSSQVPAPGFAGFVDEAIVVPSEPGSLVHDVDTR